MVVANNTAAPEDAPSVDSKKQRSWFSFRGGGGGKQARQNAGKAAAKTNAAAAAAAFQARSNAAAPSAPTNAHAEQKPPGILKFRNYPDRSTAAAGAAAASPAQHHAHPQKATAATAASPSWFCRTAHFRRQCDAAFDVIDGDRSGTVSEAELYAGLLLIHLKLGTYAGPAACRPLSRERCRAVFVTMDRDESGSLDRDEFASVMAVLCSNVVLRVLVQWSMTLLIVPWIAQSVWRTVVHAASYIADAIANLDERSAVAHRAEVALEGAGAWCLAQAPPPLVAAGTRLNRLFAAVPVAVWQAVPLTLLSTVLGIVVVPYCIFQVDDYFQRVADRRGRASI